jgi:hypothetical protein
MGSPLKFIELTRFPEHCSGVATLRCKDIGSCAKILGAFLFVKYSMVPVCYLQEKKLIVFAEES